MDGTMDPSCKKKRVKNQLPSTAVGQRYSTTERTEGHHHPFQNDTSLTHLNSSSPENPNCDFSSSSPWLMRGKNQLRQNISRKEQTVSQRTPSKKKMVVKNLPLEVTREDLKRLLRKFGDIENVTFRPTERNEKMLKEAYVSLSLVKPLEELPDIIQDQKASHFDWHSLNPKMKGQEGKEKKQTKRVAKRKYRRKKKSTKKAKQKYLEKREDIYISKTVFKRNIFGSKGKRNDQSRPTKIIKNFKVGHFTKPGQPEYHREKRNEYCEDKANYYFREEDGSAFRGRAMGSLFRPVHSGCYPPCF